MRFTWALMTSLLFLAACKHANPSGASGAATEGNSSKIPATKRAGVVQKSAPATNAPRVTLLQELKGKVAAVNPTLRFIVIDFYLSQLPQLGLRMSVYRQGLKVGEVKISGPERSRNVAADIVAGDARVGDEVRLD